MTLLQIIQEAHEVLGEQSDLQYTDETGAVDVASDGWIRYVDAVNRACLELVSWKFPDGRQLRFRLTEEQAILRSKALDCTISSGSTSSQIIVTDLPDEADDYYSSMVIRYGAETRKILMSRTIGATTELFLMTSPSIDPTGLSGLLSDREYAFESNQGLAFGSYVDGIGYDPSTGYPMEILSIYDQTSDTELEVMSRDDPLLSRSAQLGTPSAYYKLMRSIRFDVWPDESRTYLVRYARSPRLFGYDDQAVSPELPDQFHHAIALHVIWWGLMRAQENDSAYAAKQNLDYALRHIKTEYDFQGEFKTHQITLNREV